MREDGKEPKGKVWLVGAGPGDAGLLTLKGRQVLEQAEVVVYDRLVGLGILAMIPPGARLIDVGKVSGFHTVPQGRINQLLLLEAQAGHRVVRLKGGDPFVFGRGGEELELLAANQIPFEVVPGITAAVAVPAYSGIPLTHRDYGNSVHLITGHQRADQSLAVAKLDYKALVGLQGTLVFFMGLAALDQICGGLLAAGMAPDMPGAVLASGTTAGQRRVVAPLDKLVQAVEVAGIKSPALILVGKVCQLADQLHWAEDRPLGGLRVLVTRPRQSSQPLVQALQNQGAEVVALPTIRRVAIVPNQPLEQALNQIETYRWLVFTSPIGVQIFFQQLGAYKIDIRRLAGLKLGAVGSATAAALSERGLLVDLMPAVYSGRALGQMLGQVASHGLGRVLLPRSAQGGAPLIQALAQAAVAYDDIPLYETIPVQDHGALSEELLQQQPFDYVTFTSASTVAGFAKAWPKLCLQRVKALCIGEQTAAAAKKMGMDTYTAEEASMDSMVELLIKLWRKD